MAQFVKRLLLALFLVFSDGSTKEFTQGVENAFDGITDAILRDVHLSHFSKEIISASNIVADYAHEKTWATGETRQQDEALTFGSIAQEFIMPLSLSVV